MSARHAPAAMCVTTELHWEATLVESRQLDRSGLRLGPGGTSIFGVPPGALWPLPFQLVEYRDGAPLLRLAAGMRPALTRLRAGTFASLASLVDAGLACPAAGGVCAIALVGGDRVTIPFGPLTLSIAVTESSFVRPVASWPRLDWSFVRTAGAAMIGALALIIALAVTPTDPVAAMTRAGDLVARQILHVPLTPVPVHAERIAPAPASPRFAGRERPARPPSGTPRAHAAPHSDGGARSGALTRMESVWRDFGGGLLERGSLDARLALLGPGERGAREAGPSDEHGMASRSTPYGDNGQVGLDIGWRGSPDGRGANGGDNEGVPALAGRRPGGDGGGGPTGAGPGTVPPPVRGCLGAEAVQRVLSRIHSQARYCYEQELARTPNLRGKAVTVFVIDAAGAVVSARVEESTLASPPVEACLLRAVQRLRFPPCSGGGVAEVTYPWLFDRARAQE